MAFSACKACNGFDLLSRLHGLGRHREQSVV